MSNSNKILFAVFFILLTITGVELFYFFFYKPSVVGNIKKNLSVTNSQNSVTSLSKAQIDSLAVNRDQIKYLSTLKKIDIDQLKTFYSVGGIGIVASIKNITGKQISFDLVDENGKKSTNIRFPIDENVPFKIYQSNNSIMTPVNLGDLSEGDKIKFLWTYDLEKPPGKDDIYDNELIIYKNKNEKIY